MNPVSRIIVALVSLVGFFVIPASVLSFFLQWKLETPRFYTALVANSDILFLPVEARIRKAGLDPSAFKPDLSAARQTVRKELDSRLAPQVAQKIEGVQEWFSQGSPFPRLRFDLKDLRSGLVDSVPKGGYKHPLVAGYLSENYKSLPGACDADQWVRFVTLRKLVKEIRPYAPTIFLLRKYVPLVSFLFLILFLFTTFQVRPAFYYFASLLTASGGFFLIVFGLVFLADLAVGQRLIPLLIQAMPLPGPALPKAAMLNGWDFLIRTACIQGAFSCLTMIACGGLFYMTRRKSRR